jgi:hypothetical protein
MLNKGAVAYGWDIAQARSQLTRRTSIEDLKVSNCLASHKTPCDSQVRLDYRLGHTVQVLPHAYQREGNNNTKKGDDEHDIIITKRRGPVLLARARPKWH